MNYSENNGEEKEGKEDGEVKEDKENGEVKKIRINNKHFHQILPQNTHLL